MIKNDIFGFLMKFIKLSSEYSRLFCSNVAVKIIFGLKGVKYGKNCRFYGVPYVVRYPGSMITIGDNCTFRSDSTVNLARSKKVVIKTFDKNAHVNIGNNVGMNGVAINCMVGINICDDVLIGFNSILTDTDYHSINPDQRLTGQAECKPIFLERNVWLGANTVILKGVQIGHNSVIGVNSVVFSSIPDNVIAIGNPCRVVKKI